MTGPAYIGEKWLCCSVHVFFPGQFRKLLLVTRPTMSCFSAHIASIWSIITLHRQWPCVVRKTGCVNVPTIPQTPVNEGQWERCTECWQAIVILMAGCGALVYHVVLFSVMQLYDNIIKSTLNVLFFIIGRNGLLQCVWKPSPLPSHVGTSPRTLDIIL